MISTTETEKDRFDLFVDESGQDTKGKLFVVGVVAVESYDEISMWCDSVERSSAMGKSKWSSAKREWRITYLRTIISDGPSLGLTLFYQTFRVKTPLL